MVITDVARGGRWISLRLAGREWLWSRPDRRRDGVRPGDPFVDAGGLEECVPTVRGTPDHGAAWSRAWRRVGADEVADCGDFVLRRQLRVSSAVTASYRLEASPGFRFVWAAHALLDVSPAARVELPSGAPTRIYPDDGPSYVDGAWPAGGLDRLSPGQLSPGQLSPDRLSLDRLGPDDGTAVGAVVVGPSAVRVVDGEQLELRLSTDQPTSIALWRNLRGWPPELPYRSIGVEPMLGAVFDLATAGPDDAVTVPAGGAVTWDLELSAR